MRSALARPLPGLPVQMGMAPVPRPGAERILDPFLDCRRAGVLVLLYTSPLHIVLTRRTDAVDNHRGQISFPGGSMDPGEDAVTAALREAHEELGVDPARVQVLGQLSPLYIPPSGFCIYPVVAYTAERPAFTPSPDEVAEVLEIPVAHLSDPATRCEETWLLRGENVRVPFYALGPHKIWGATAMVLCELLALLRGYLQEVFTDESDPLPRIRRPGSVAAGGAACPDPRPRPGVSQGRGRGRQLH